MSGMGVGLGTLTRPMRPRCPAVFVLAAAVVFPGTLNGQSAEEPDVVEGVLEGRVLEWNTGEPVVGALVRLEDTPLFEFTDDGGRFRFTGLSPGSYTVVATGSGFRDQARAGATVTEDGEVSIELFLREQTFELPGLVVTAGRSPERFGETTASVDVIDAGDLERRSAITVDEALRYASGVIFNAEQIDIRGASGLARGVGSRVLVMLDGHRFLSGTTGEVSFEALPVLSTERIEVVKGAASTLYGTNALGGVVNVITRPVPEQPETLARVHAGVFDVPGEFEFGGGTQTYQGVDVRHARRVGGLGTFVEVGRKTSDGYRQNDDFDRWFVHGGFTVPREDGPPLAELFAVWGREEKKRFFQWASRDRPLEVVDEAVGDEVRNIQASLGATLTPVAGEDVLLRIRPSVYRADVQNNFHENQDFHESNRYDTELQLSLHRWKDHVVTVGLEGAYTRVESNILGEPELVDGAVYVQDEIGVREDLRVALGVRLDYHDTDEGESEFKANPKVGLVWTPSNRRSIRLTVSRGYRAPSAVEQFVTATQSGFKVVPNLSLEGESAWAFEAGLTARPTDWIFWEAGLFQTEFDGLVEPSPVPGEPFTFQFRNVADARIRGLDLSARFGIEERHFGAHLNYIVLDTEDLRTGEPLPYRSRHNLNASADVGPVGVDFQYRSRVERVLAFPLDPRDDITLFDLRLGFRFAGVGGQLKVGNLFQETYVNIQERNLGPSRSFQLTLTSGF